MGISWGYHGDIMGIVCSVSDHQPWQAAKSTRISWAEGKNIIELRRGDFPVMFDDTGGYPRGYPRGYPNK